VQRAGCGENRDRIPVRYAHHPAVKLGGVRAGSSEE
jgi:hypothetical protein